MYKSILIRSDSSSKIGLGHVMRDLVLASRYKDARITFAARDLKGNINDKIVENNYDLAVLGSNKKEELLTLIKKLKTELLIIDHYGIDHKYEKYLKEQSGVTILSLDDTYEKHHCDILLNHNISADPKRYKDLVPKNCEIRCGKRYTLLRDEFLKEKKNKKTRSEITNIFVAIGGSDHSNINVKVLKVIKKVRSSSFGNIKVNLVTTKANKNLKELRHFARGKKWIKLHLNSSSIARLMKKSDLAIITPSVTLNEVHYMNVPFIAIKTAKNQDDIYRYLKRKRLQTLKRFDKKKLKQSIKKMLNGLAK